MENVVFSPWVNEHCLQGILGPCAIVSVGENTNFGQSSNGFQFDMVADKNEDEYTNRGFQPLLWITIPV